MPDKKSPRIGEIVYLNTRGAMKAYKVTQKHNAGYYSLESCDNKHETIFALATDMVALESQHSSISGKIHDLVEETFGDDLSPFAGISDEELERMAPPLDESEQAETNAQEEYYFLCNAIGSNLDIFSLLLQYAMSDKKLDDAAVLAMRDRAESIGNYEIVEAIDAHFENDAGV